MVLLVEPVFQVYELAPIAVKLAACPAQIVAELRLMLGVALTVIVLVVVLVQPFKAVPVMVTMVVARGLKTKLLPFEPVLHV
jgi:hypothetical protein